MKYKVRDKISYHGVKMERIEVYMPSERYRMSMWLTPYGIYACEDEATRVIRKLWRWAGEVDGVHTITRDDKVKLIKEGVEG